MLVFMILAKGKQK